MTSVMPILVLIATATAVTFAAEVKMQVRDGLPIVDGVFINGHGPHRFLLDTGTNVNLIDKSLAHSIGLDPTFHSELSSSSGVTVAPGGDGIRISLSSVEAGEQKFLFLPLDAIHKHWPDVEGVLGQWFLSQFDYRIDLHGRRLEISKHDENEMPTNAGTRAPFRMFNGRPLVTTSLGDLVLDSGSTRLVLFGVQPDPGFSPVEHQLRTVAGSVNIGMVFTKQLVIEGRRDWRGHAVAVPHPSESGVGGLLPLNLFKAITVCNSRSYVVFE